MIWRQLASIQEAGHVDYLCRGEKQECSFQQKHIPSVSPLEHDISCLDLIGFEGNWSQLCKFGWIM